MNIAELKNLIENLPDEMQVAASVNDLIVQICPDCSGVGDVKFENDDNVYPLFVLTAIEHEPETNIQLN